MSDLPLPPSSPPPGPDDRAAQSPAMRDLWRLAARAAPTESTVLITGESGVGKERVAKWLHAASPRAKARFQPVDCAALPETLFETEPFGHARAPLPARPWTIPACSRRRMGAPSSSTRLARYPWRHNRSSCA